jgi:hypothetical protein
MVWVFPTPGAYPRKSLNLPPFFVGETSSSHCSGVFGIAFIVVETSNFVDAWESEDQAFRVSSLNVWFGDRHQRFGGCRFQACIPKT